MTLCTIGPCSTDRHQGSVTQLAHTRARCLGSFDGHVDSVRESSHWTRGGKLKQGLWLGKMGRVRQRWRESWRKRAGERCEECQRHSLTSCTARHFLSLLKTLHVWMLRAEEKPSQQYGWHFIAGWLLQYPSHSMRLQVSRCWRERLLLCEFGELSPTIALSLITF